MISTMDPTHKDLDGTLDTIGWGLLFVMSGGMLLVPGLPDGTWLAGLGALIIGLAVVRSMLRLPVSRFGLAVAAALVAIGVTTIAGLAVPWFALLLVGCGFALVANAVVARSRDA
jgi:hypothetical protein